MFRESSTLPNRLLCFFRFSRRGDGGDIGRRHLNFNPRSCVVAAFARDGRLFCVFRHWSYLRPCGGQWSPSFPLRVCACPCVSVCFVPVFLPVVSVWFLFAWKCLAPSPFCLLFLDACFDLRLLVFPPPPAVLSLYVLRCT